MGNMTYVRLKTSGGWNRRLQINHSNHKIASALKKEKDEDQFPEVQQLIATISFSVVCVTSSDEMSIENQHLRS